MTTILGVKGWDLSEYAISANAILGIRDSGKTYTATEAAEELYDADVPFIALDPIGVWHSLRVPGKGKGYPVVVAGGRHGDLPLDPKKVGAIVRAAMEANVSLVLDLFSVDLSKADWRRIVRETVEILMHENMDHGLRHVFIEEAAEFVPQRVTDGQVFAAVEKLVRMGGNSKLGCTLINQRSADLNKSVLELCANVFVHRQTGKNTLLDLRKWLSVLDPDSEKAVASTLPDLKSGECWAFINDLKKPVRLKVPEKNSLHPDRRAVTAKGADKRQPVPATAFVEQMRAKLADKPKAAPAPASQPVEKVNTADQRARERALTAARAEGYAAGYQEGDRDGFARGAAVALEQGFGAVRDALKAFAGVQFVPPKRLPSVPKVLPAAASAAPGPPQPAAAPRAGARGPAAPAMAIEGLTAPQSRVLQSLAFWSSIGHESPTREQVAAVAGYRPGSGNFNNIIGGLSSAGHTEVPQPGRLRLLTKIPPPTTDEAQAKLWSVFENPQRRLVEAALAASGDLSRDELAEAAGYSPGSGNFNNICGSLTSMDVLQRTGQGRIGISDWAREVLA